MSITPTTTKEIDNIIKPLNDTSPSYDEVHVKVLKRVSHVLSPALSKLINSLIQVCFLAI